MGVIIHAESGQQKAGNFATPQGFVWYNDFAETRLLESDLLGLVNKAGFGSRHGITAAGAVAARASN